MSRFLGWFHSAKSLVRGPSADHETADEIAFHLEQQVGKHTRQGMTADDARAAALREFGGVSRWRQEAADARFGQWWAGVRQDTRFAARVLWRRPGFALVAVLTLGVGIGAATAMFSVVRGVILEAPPFADPSRLVAIVDRKATSTDGWDFTSFNRFDEVRKRGTSFTAVAALHGCAYAMLDGGMPRRLTMTCVSPAFFPILGVKPFLGRQFAPNADQPGQNHELLLSYRFWRDHFAANPSVLGTTIAQPAGGAAFTIVGVMPPGMQFGGLDPDLWAPLVDGPSPYRDLHEWLVFGRLKPGVSVAQAGAELSNIAGELARETPATATGWGSTAISLQRFYSDRGDTRLAVLVLFVAVGVLLLIACANVASLFLARGAGRRAELALRVAIGASSARITRQLVTESLLVGLLGAGLGFLLSLLAHRLLLAMAPALPTFRADAVRIDAPMLAFTIVLGMVTSIAFGFAGRPRGAASQVHEALRSGARNVTGRSAVHGALIAGEISLAIVLLSTAGLLLESFHRLRTDDPGFDFHDVLTFTACCVNPAHYSTPDARANFHTEAVRQLSAVPGVESVAEMSGNTALPMLRQSAGGSSTLDIRGQDQGSAAAKESADVVFVGGNFFRTLRIGLLSGRDFGPADTPQSTPVVVINEALARRLAPNGQAVGLLIRPSSGDGSDAWRTVIGVVRNTEQRGLGTGLFPTLYLPASQIDMGYLFFAIRTHGDPLQVARPVQNALHHLDPELTIDGLSTLDAALGAPLLTRRFAASLLTLFAAIALALAAIGVFGVTAYSVAQRTREMGVRLALGAQPGHVVRLVVGQEMRTAAVGVAAGIPAALFLGHLSRRLLFGISAANPVTLGTAAILLFGVVAVAAYLPSRRVARLDAARVLRAS